jgi:hypothetical protein
MALGERGQHERVGIAQPSGNQAVIHDAGEFGRHARRPGLGGERVTKRSRTDHHQEARHAGAQRGCRLDERRQVLLLGETSDVEHAALPCAPLDRSKSAQIHTVGNQMDAIREGHARHVLTQLLRRHDHRRGPPKAHMLEGAHHEARRRRARETRVPEPVGGHERRAPTRMRHERRDNAGQLKRPQHGAATELLAMSHRHLDRSHESLARRVWPHDADPFAQVPAVGEVRERFGQIAEVPDSRKRACVRLEISLDQTRCLSSTL